MPEEIMGGLILQRLGAVEILISVQKVCTTWRRICKDPAMWKVIDMNHRFYGWVTDYMIENLTKQAVHRSCGELIDISLEVFGTDDILDHISRCSSKLNRLCITDCYRITGRGLTNALKRLPHLETLELSHIFIDGEYIEVIGRICPQLKSFKMTTKFIECDDVAPVIANSMPTLRHLQLVGITMTDDDGVQPILNGCPHLESRKLHECFYLHPDGKMEKLCIDRIKDLKFNGNIIVEGDEEYDEDFANYINDFDDRRNMGVPDSDIDYDYQHNHDYDYDMDDYGF